MSYLLTILSYFKEIFITALLGVSLFFIIHIGNKYIDEEKRFKVSKKQAIYAILAFVLAFAIYKIYGHSKGIINELFYTLFISIIFSYLLNPIVNIFESKGIKRGWGVLLVYGLLIAIIGILSVSIIPSIIDEFKNLANVLPRYFTKTRDFFNDLYGIYSKNIDNLPQGFESIRQNFDENLKSIQNVIIETISSITNSTMGIFSTIFNIILIPIVAFYFIKDKNYFKKNINQTIPKKYRSDIGKVARDIDSALGKFVRGQLIVAAFVGLATAIGLFVLGVNFALTIGIIAGLANIIPYFGPIIGMVPAIFFALLDKPIKALWVVILFLVIQQIEGNILSPKIVGESVGLHPVVVIISLIIGGSLMGILGMLLAIPIVTVIRIVVNFTIEKLSKI